MTIYSILYIIIHMPWSFWEPFIYSGLGYQQYSDRISNIQMVSATLKPYQQPSLGMLLIFLSATLSATWVCPLNSCAFF